MTKENNTNIHLRTWIPVEYKTYVPEYLSNIKLM